MSEAVKVPDVPRELGQKLTGTCKTYDLEKGYGFITCDDNGPDCFIHQTDVVCEGFRCLTEGARVELIYTESRDKPTATHVTGIGGTPLASYDSKKDAKEKMGLSELKGTVKWFNTEKSFGFITPMDGSEDIFVHIRSVSSAEPLVQGQRVKYSLRTQKCDSGGPDKVSAANVVLISQPQAQVQQQFPVQTVYMPYGAQMTQQYVPVGSNGQPVYFQQPPQQMQQMFAQPQFVQTAQFCPQQDGVQNTATVKWFNNDKGFGFLIPNDGSPEIYVKADQVNGGQELTQGVSVVYTPNSNGAKSFATNVSVVSASQAQVVASAALKVRQSMQMGGQHQVGVGVKRKVAVGQPSLGGHGLGIDQQQGMNMFKVQQLAAPGQASMRPQGVYEQQPQSTYLPLADAQQLQLQQQVYTQQQFQSPQAVQQGRYDPYSQQIMY